MSLTRQENLAQAEAFRRMHGDELVLIEVYAPEFRDIINKFEAHFGYPPTADDLLWLSSERHGYDITQQQ